MKPISFETLGGATVHIWIRSIFLVKQVHRRPFDPDYLVCSDTHQWAVSESQWETLRVAMECERDH